MQQRMTVDGLATQVNDLLSEYVAVHVDIYGASLWRTLRRVIPIPGVFEAIPYDTHSQRLRAVRDGLGNARLEAGDLRPTIRGAQTAFLRDLDLYVQALDAAVSDLEQICDDLADKAAGQPGPTRAAYDQALAEYGRARANYIRLGAALNDSFAAARPEV